MSMASNVVTLPTPEPDLVRIKPGTYSATYLRHETSAVFGKRKVRIDFRLIEHLELIASRWYHLAPFKGRVQSPKHGDLVRELSDVFGRRVRHDRLPISDLRDLVVLVEVRDVMKDAKGAPMSEHNRYSVISRVIGRAV